MFMKLPYAVMWWPADEQCTNRKCFITSIVLMKLSNGYCFNKSMVLMKLPYAVMVAAQRMSTTAMKTTPPLTQAPLQRVGSSGEQQRVRQRGCSRHSTQRSRQQQQPQPLQRGRRVAPSQNRHRVCVLLKLLVGVSVNVESGWMWEVSS